MATYAPRLDAIGNSVKGQFAARFLSAQLGLNLFVSQPVVGPPGRLGPNTPTN